MRKKIFIILFSLFCLFKNANAEQSIHLKYTRDYQIGADNLYMLCFSALNQNKYEVIEFQSKGGLILFSANNQKYLLTVSKNWTKSAVKILPKDGNLTKGFEVQDTIFKTIDENLDYQLKE